MTTIKDIAKRANVSISTVSLVLNNRDTVKLETRIAIQKAIEELDYTPNQYARSLVTNKKRIIGIVKNTTAECEGNTFDSMLDTCLSEMLHHVVPEVDKTEYSFLLGWMKTSGENRAFPSIVHRTKIDGMLFIGGLVDEELLSRLHNLDFPVVLLYSRDDSMDYIDTDVEKGMSILTEHLIAKGHKKIALINSPIDSQTSEIKLRGFRNALQRNGLEFVPELTAFSGFAGQAAYDAIRCVWATGHEPTAVIAGGDGIATGILRFLYDNGLHCPDDVSVAAYERSLLTEHASPALTSIDISMDEIAAQGCHILFNRFSKPTARTVHMIIEPKLIERNSVKTLL